MTQFQKNITDRLVSLNQTSDFANKKAQFNRVYSMALVDVDWNEIAKVNDFHAAFLDLMNERHPTLLKQFQKHLEERFYEMYSNSEDENERKCTPKDELVLHKIQVPSQQSDDWQLMYEMNSDDTIFHVDFEGWTYKSIGVTH